eukprot:m.64597 g.64597  ORF g.64597 m.64597 type:complete len:56 (+) comp35267_c0_seq4:261-428(+)
MGVATLSPEEGCSVSPQNEQKTLSIDRQDDDSENNVNTVGEVCDTISISLAERLR